MGFRYVSLFAGLGGFDFALNQLGGQCVMTSEIDKYASQALELLYEPGLNRGDITKLAAEDVPDHDFLVAGFPCQAFSVAGQKRGFEDTRGTLFFEVARIAKVKQPKVMLLENVKGLVSHDGGRTLDVILNTLDQLNYTVDFRVLNSKYFGVPQNRERIFIVCLLNGKEQEWTVTGNDVVSKARRRAVEMGIKTFNFEWPTNNTVDKRLRDILEPLVDEKYYLNQSKTSALIAKLEADLNEQRIIPTDEPTVQSIGSLTPDDCTRHGQRDEVYADSGVMRAIIATDYKVPVRIATEEQFTEGDGIAYAIDASYSKGLGKEIGTGRRTHVLESDSEVRPVLTPERTSKQQNGRQIKENDEEMFTLTATDRHGVMIEDTGCSLRTRSYAGQDQQLEVRKDGLSNTITSVTKDAMVLEGEPDVNVIGRIDLNGHDLCKRIYDTDGVSPTIPTGSSGNTTPKIVTRGTKRYRIRKLTPLECLRLQGFPDVYYTKLRDAKISDTQIYKMAGNAVTTNVIHAIGSKAVNLL